ncbi:chorismate mutase [Aneurinibacillus aneurinilyticus]|jgi:chorismate mutase|uniref:chorismate mutase n=2 Tax=Aneurinibacillus aneurinilyticus TaxID=1391 RepID=A0A848CSD0_ANEAE|nr:chorismate mutase [Aneurinibacillus aneurinilyticus]ERI08358.1 chorismate mutase [Aneurinibacillus aneurinilyticus ATCC 12856]MCI1692965.1 chorismate mutase [Aneurinibacillus aneurinilyticus]MED0669859.1 chorismate mutase [Aneurinibacillus aneurinilyticus]MED0705768.1 chorismate mutase [Aneurinibacillus aneurinilyticus]MED0725763.1 chorismate mutase [Aneurinibacillus aneurinilyticus]
MAVRGIRGATTVTVNEEAAILEATEKLMRSVIEANEIDHEDVASVMITVTHDLDAAFPARGVRAIPGFDLVPLMCSNEIPVPGSLEKCIRVMMLVNTEKSIRDIRHIFLEGAAALRPDLNSQIK